MRSALCLYGKIGGSQGKNGLGKTINFHECARTVQEHVITPNGCDVFMHCWSAEHKTELMSLYRPKSYTIEPQIIFDTTLDTAKGRADEFICKSRWYSTRESVKLKSSYEREHEFIYEWVMVCRYDVLFFVDFDFRMLEPGYFYASHFNDWGYKSRKPNRENHTLKNRRLLDIWFIGPSQFMNRLATLYDSFYDYAITDPHRAAWDHVQSFSGDPMQVTRFKWFRWYDYELWRIKHGAKRCDTR